MLPSIKTSTPRDSTTMSVGSGARAMAIAYWWPAHPPPVTATFRAPYDSPLSASMDAKVRAARSVRETPLDVCGVAAEAMGSATRSCVGSSCGRAIRSLTSTAPMLSPG